MTNLEIVRKYNIAVVKMIGVYCLIILAICYYLLNIDNTQMKAFAGMMFAIAIPIGIPMAKLTGGRTVGTSVRIIGIMWMLIVLGTILLAMFSVLFMS